MLAPEAHNRLELLFRPRHPFALYLDLFNLDKSLPETVMETLMEHLLETRRDGGQILNALDIPMGHQSTKPKVYTTDLHAWRHTIGQKICQMYEAYPTANMNWALCGSANSMTFFHINSDGFASQALIVTGGKYWVFYREQEPLSLQS